MKIAIRCAVAVMLSAVPLVAQSASRAKFAAAAHPAPATTLQSADSTRYQIALAYRAAQSRAVAAIPVTYPGAAKLRRPALVAPDTALRMRARFGTDTVERELSAVTVSSFIPADSANVLYAASSWIAKGTAYYDTLALTLPTMAPRWERWILNGGTNVISYDGAHVHAVRQPKDSAAVVFDTTFTHPVFAFVEVEPLLGTLPLRKGFETILPLYSENDRAVEMDTVTVAGVGRIPANGHRTWIVRFADPAIVATYEIDDVTREATGYSLVSRRRGGLMRRTRDSSQDAKDADVSRNHL